MTSAELLDKMTPSEQHRYFAQLNSDGLNYDQSDVFCRLIKDAARCNRYNSDIFYDMNIIDRRMHEFVSSEKFDPIWIGFRKNGVDCTEFVLNRVSDKSVYGEMNKNYFALYSITVEKKDNYFYDVILNEYYV